MIPHQTAACNGHLAIVHLLLEGETEIIGSELNTF